MERRVKFGSFADVSFDDNEQSERRVRFAPVIASYVAEQTDYR